MEVVNELLVLFCFTRVSSLCFSYKTVFILTHRFHSFYPSDSLSDRPGEGVSEGAVWALAAGGIKPLQPYLNKF